MIPFDDICHPPEMRKADKASAMPLIWAKRVLGNPTEQDRTIQANTPCFSQMAGAGLVAVCLMSLQAEKRLKVWMFRKECLTLHARNRTKSFVLTAYQACFIKNDDYERENDHRTGHPLVEGSTKAATGLARGREETLGWETTIFSNCMCMKLFQLTRINAKAPYKVSFDGKQYFSRSGGYAIRPQRLSAFAMRKADLKLEN